MSQLEELEELRVFIRTLARDLKPARAELAEARATLEWLMGTRPDERLPEFRVWNWQRVCLKREIRALAVAVRRDELALEIAHAELDAGLEEEETHD